MQLQPQIRMYFKFLADHREQEEAKRRAHVHSVIRGLIKIGLVAGTLVFAVVYGNETATFVRNLF